MLTYRQYQKYQYFLNSIKSSRFEAFKKAFGYQQDEESLAKQWLLEEFPELTLEAVTTPNAIYDVAVTRIPGGTFLMGSPEGEMSRTPAEGPQHEVTVPTFFMGRYPITQAQWRAVAALPQVERELNPDPSRFKGDNRPVEQVSWYDAVEFCARLSIHTQRAYRLPSEAEWEYACRAGTTRPFYFGETITPDLANYDGNYTYGVGPKGIFRKETTTVGSFLPNAFGLYDMHGNVFEWCQDTWHSNYDGAPTDGSAWIEGGSAASRVRRGGSWYNNPRYCRSAYRLNYNAVNRDYNLGFRICYSE